MQIRTSHRRSDKLVTYRIALYYVKWNSVSMYNGFQQASLSPSSGIAPSLSFLFLHAFCADLFYVSSELSYGFDNPIWTLISRSNNVAQ